MVDVFLTYCKENLDLVEPKRQHGGSKHGQVVSRNKNKVHDKIWKDYFNVTLVYGDKLFRSFYNIKRILF